MAYKILRNTTNFDMIVRLICRVGDEPNNKGERINVPVKAGATVKASYGKDGPYLNGIRIQSEGNGKMTRKRQVVTVRGSNWDDTLNTNAT
ncbi:MAG: hypothetical protein GY946_11175, partial [bacterium]|nr:hypothetical protein [bacterium]